MHYYPPALDYAKWILLLLGTAFAFSMASEPTGRRRGLLKLTCFVLMAFGAAFGAIAGVLFNERAPHLTVTGTLSHIELYSGKGSRTHFDVELPSGRVSRLRFDSAIRQLREGEAAEVTYQAGSLTVLKLSVLDGSLAGGIYRASDNTFGSYAVLSVAAILLFYGVIDWFADGTGATTEPRNKAPQSDGDVDSGSMLKF